MFNTNQRTIVQAVKSASVLALPVAMSLCTLSVNAQTLEEVVVVAQKREQSIQDVSIAITAFSGDQMRELGVQSSVDIARFTPGVSIAATSGGQDAQFTIRGVTQTDFNDSIEPPNAIYVDEGYMATVQGNRFGLFDVNRVEVLRGPQGTLFGRNATGGLVHYLTNKPTDEFEAYVDTLVGSNNQVRVEGAVSGPLGDNLSGRLSAVHSQHDEVIDNKYPQGNQISPVTGQPFVPSESGQDDYWNDDSTGLRGQLKWDINEDAEFWISAFVWEEEIATNGSYEQGATTAIIDSQGRHVNSIFASKDPQACEAISAESGDCIPVDFVDGDFGDPFRPVAGGDLFGYKEVGGRGDQNASLDHSIDDFNTYDQYGLTARLSWSFDWANLTWITHYMDYEKEQSLDADVSPTPQALVINNNDSDTFSQEIRFDGEGDSYRWVGGFYYLDFNNENAIGFGWPEDSPVTRLISGVDPALGNGAFEAISFADWDRESYSVFGQFDYDLTDRLTLSLGGRVVQEDHDYEYRQRFFQSSIDEEIEDNQEPINTFLQYPDYSDDTSDTLWAGRLALQFQASEDVMVYGSIDRGTKAGGFNGKLNDFSPPLPQTEINYDEEILYAYEVGFKSTLFNGTTRLNGSAYYYDYQDYQAFVFVNSSGFVRNADAETVGVELELVSRPIEPLDIQLSVSWIDAEVQDLEIATGLERDVIPPYTPEWQLAALGRYTWADAVADGDVSFQATATYADESYYNIRNFDSQLVDERTIVDIRLAWLSENGTWEIALFGNNIFDEDYVASGFDLSGLCGCSEEAWGKPSWWGLQARVNFQ